jgi:hypothetical protein
MSSQITRKLFTIDDCYKMAEVGILSADERTELINGEILVVPPPRTSLKRRILVALSLAVFTAQPQSVSTGQAAQKSALIRAALTKASGVAPLPQ